MELRDIRIDAVRAVHAVGLGRAAAGRAQRPKLDGHAAERLEAYEVLIVQ